MNTRPTHNDMSSDPQSRRHALKSNSALITTVILGFMLFLAWCGFAGYTYVYHWQNNVIDTSSMMNESILLYLATTVFLISTCLFVLLLRNIIHVRKLKNNIQDYRSKAETESFLAKKTASTLKSAHKEHAGFLDLIGCALLILDNKGRILSANKAAASMIPSLNNTSHTPYFTSFVNYTDQDKIASKILGLDKIKSYETNLQIKISENAFKSIHLILHLTDNKPQKIVASLIDHDDHAHMRQNLENTEMHYRYIVENSGFGFFEMNVDGTPRTLDLTFAKLIGYASEDEAIAHISNMFETLYAHSKDASTIRHMLSKDGHVLSYECPVKNNAGELLWVSQSIYAVKDTQDKTQYYKGHFENIHKRKTAELALQTAKNNSDLANRSKSEFLANMSHELRTPLNAILGFSDIMRIGLKDDHESAQYHIYASDIHHSGSHLLKIINEILDIAKIEVNEKDLSEEEINVEQTIRTVCDVKSVLIERKNIQLEIEADTNAYLIADRKALKQIIINLLSNALKFTPEKGRVTIAVHVTNKNEITLSVTDTGPGLSDEEIKKALSPFGKTPQSLVQNSESTGLGLTLTKALIDMHGGTFDLLSQRSMGTTAIVTFPAHRTA